MAIPMRVLMLSKACVTGAYQRKLEAIAALGVDLTVAVPPLWVDERGAQYLERTHTQGYTLAETPILLNGNFHLHFYPRFGALLKQVRPHLVHLDEEPYNFATWLALRQAERAGTRALFFSWQNLNRRYPPPFRWLEHDVLRRAAGAIAGNAEAAAVWRAKGYTGPLWVIPQFGVDPERFRPGPPRAVPPGTLTVGYAGRLVPEKGVDLLLLAAAQTPGVQVRIVGAGPERPLLEDLIRRLGLTGRATIAPLMPSAETATRLYPELDVLVLPSRTRPNWKEQFGRVLIEAMACEVPVIGARCGEIPNVIGDAGLLFPEEGVEALAAHLAALRDQPARRGELGARGRARVLARFTQQRIAEQTVAAYTAVHGAEARAHG